MAKKVVLAAVFLAIFAIFNASCATVSGDGFKARQPHAITIMTVYPPVMVDYDRTMEQMISDGQYTCVNPAVIMNVRKSGAGAAEIIPVLVRVDKDITDKAISKRLKKYGLRHATLQEALAFGAKYPNEQRYYEISALGSVWDDNGKDVACLGEDRDEERCVLRCFLNGNSVVPRYILAVSE